MVQGESHLAGDPPIDSDEARPSRRDCVGAHETAHEKRGGWSGGFRRTDVKPTLPTDPVSVARRNIAGSVAERRLGDIPQLLRIPVAGTSFRSIPAAPMQVQKVLSAPETDAAILRSDEQLMAAIAQGDEGALGTLIERHWGGIVWYAGDKLGRTDDSEDVAQEVFVRVWEHRHRWDARGSVKAFLFQVARNLVISRLRHQRVKQRVEPELTRRVPNAVTPIDETAQRELQDALEAAIAKLPERRREAFVFVRTLGLGLHEAAEVMGVSRRTVANHVYMAVTELQKELRAFLP